MPPRNNKKPRTPSGELSRAGIREYQPGQVRRALDDLMHRASDALAGHEIGRLCLSGHLTTDHVATAARYAELWKAYQAVTGAPSPSARSASMDPTGGSDTRPDMDPDKAAAIKRGWHDAYTVLVTASGDRLAEWVFDVVILDRAAVTVEEKVDIKAGLAALAAYWGGRRG